MDKEMEDLSNELFETEMLDRNLTYYSYPDEDVPSYRDLPLTISYFVLSAMGLVGNALVIFIFLRYAKMRTVSNIYIFNLAVADALLMFAFLFLATQEAAQTWPFGIAWCKLILAIEFITPLVSIDFVMVMGIDRCMVLYRPLISSKWRKPKVASLLSAAVWTVFLLPAILVVLNGSLIENSHVCAIYWSNQYQDFFFNVCQITLGFLQPLEVIVLCLLMIAVKAQPPGHPVHATKYRGSDRTRMVTTLFVVHTVCWLPLFVVKTFSSLTDAALVLGHGFFMYAIPFLTVMSVAKSSINPVLYWYLSEDFRQSFQMAMFCMRNNLARHEVENNQGESA
ncbi:somatostatin receptor type 5-like [Ambystoma mexicanum]|uniref:somatostatin receptor type 5-like n=1 Tax=Ambystoma mexicanum TaxID=8296 RepID=UPI0037E76BC5